MKVVQIGVGYWGQNHARVWKELKDEGIIEDIFLMDINKNAVKKLGESLGLKYYFSKNDLPSIDAIDIVTPTSLHFDLSKESLKDGHHVFVEKPMTSTSSESRELIEIAENNKKILMPGHIFRYHPALNEVKRIISSGQMGKIYQIITNRSAFRIPRPDMGVILALAIHDVDIYGYILNQSKPERIFCQIQNNVLSNIEDTAHIHLEFGDTAGYIFESWINPIGKIRELTIFGQTKSLRIDYLKNDTIEIFESGFLDDNGIITTYNEGSKTIRIPYREPLKEELIAFIKACNSGKLPISDMYCGLNAVEILEYAFKSAKEGRFIDCR